MVLDISLILVVRNEEERLRNLLPLYKDVFSEILVVDQHSDDGTARIAKENCCRVERTYNWGFCEPSKNFAAFIANNDWVLSLDADEMLTESALNQLATLDINNYDCYYLIRSTPDMSISERKLRLFRRGYAHCHPMLHRDFNPYQNARVGELANISIIHNKTKSETEMDINRYNLLKQKYANTPVLHQVVIRERINKR